MSWIAGFVTQTEEQPRLLFPEWAYGVIALVFFGVLAFIVWTYRDVSNRHIHKAEPHATEHLAGPGAASHGSGHPIDHG
jgi:protein-S-isoprenylcysteine O-methyltransferase Ste14